MSGRALYTQKTDIIKKITFFDSTEVKIYQQETRYRFFDHHITLCIYKGKNNCRIECYSNGLVLTIILVLMVEWLLFKFLDTHSTCTIGEGGRGFLYLGSALFIISSKLFKFLPAGNLKNEG